MFNDPTSPTLPVGSPRLDTPASGTKSVRVEGHQPPVKAQELFALLRTSALVDPAPLQSVQEKIQRHPELDAQGLAQWLVKAKVLTSWQAGRLLKGHPEGFFLGLYKLLSRIGKGGMGVVYLAEHTRMRRRAAIKIMPPNMLTCPERLRLFFRESELIAALDHPHVVRAYDFNNEGARHYLVMEYIEGSTLEDVVRLGGPLPCNVAAEYIRQAADGLSHANERGLIHRDIKPANLMLDKDGTVKILDMGLGLVNRRGETTTDLGMVGTPDYMAPEQALDSAHVDARADIYSLGCTLYYLLTGRPPFAGESAREVLLAHQAGQVMPIQSVRADVGDDLARILARMMSKYPRDRYPNAAAVRGALAALAKPTMTHVDTLPTSKTGGKVLIADDDAVTRRTLERQLQKAGYEVIVAADGRQAIDRFRPDLAACLFDLNMPGATGLECLRVAQARQSDVPVILISSATEVGDAVAAMRDGAFDYLVKPCRVRHVLARLDEAIQARRKKTEDAATLKSLCE